MQDMRRLSAAAVEVVVLVFSAVSVWLFYFDLFGEKAVEHIRWQTVNKLHDAIGFFYLPLVSGCLMIIALLAKLSSLRAYWAVTTAAFVLVLTMTIVLLASKGAGFYPSMFLLIPLVYLVVIGKTKHDS